jgi:hypothetical protein
MLDVKPGCRLGRWARTHSMLLRRESVAAHAGCSKQAVLTELRLDHLPRSTRTTTTTPPTLLPPSIPSTARLFLTVPTPPPSLFLWVSVAPRLLPVSPSADSCATHPPPASQPLSINSWVPHCSASTSSIIAASGPSPCPAATILSAQSAVGYQRSTARTQTSPREPA